MYKKEKEGKGDYYLKNSFSFPFSTSLWPLSGTHHGSVCDPLGTDENRQRERERKRKRERERES